MYVLLAIVLVATSLGAIFSGFKRGRRGRLWFGLMTLGLTPLFFAFLSFWGEMLWFQSLGFADRFWKVVWARAGSVLGGGIASALLLYFWTLPARLAGRARRLSIAAAAAIGTVWGALCWDRILIFWYRVSTGVNDPILGRDTGFYLFILPLYDSIFLLLLMLGGIILIAATGNAVTHSMRRGRLNLGIDRNRLSESSSAIRVALGGILLILGWGSYLLAFHLMYAKLGVVAGAGWTDVHVRIPVTRVLACLGAIFGVWLLVSLPGQVNSAGARRRSILRPVLIYGAAWAIGMGLLPGLFQWLRVEPNEITFERPYIEHSIYSTNQAFGLDRVEERQFRADAGLSQSTVDSNRAMLSEIRLWDWRALKAVHKQFQEIRLYYEFNDVDVDRYLIAGQYRQVMISTREMQTSALPAQSRTFVNERFKYTHGYGITMTPVSEFTPEGLPDFVIKDIPPKSLSPELKIDRPEIYFGEMTDSHVIVDSSELEFDYPKGDANEYTRYAGTGGIPVGNFWRRLVFGWKFDGTRLLVSSYLGPESRILFHRQISDRLRTVAPFLRFDHDPYIALAGGRLYWIVDAYTVSSRYPYSCPFSSREVIESEGGQKITSHVAPELDGANYVRNSVKAIVDTYNGTVTLYIFEPQDPVLQVWRKAFPELFRAREEMPAALQAHVRYPLDMLLVQGLVYTRFHMKDPQVFYNQEDLWVRATEKYYARVQPIEPYYVIWRMPDTGKEEFVLILPFTPKNRQVMIGWMAARCDPDHYGHMLAYKFLKEKQVLGPQQMETKIDQDPFLSGQLTLWDQHGSRVIRGDVLVIPIDDTLLYVEPIYLQAETAAYPELRIVAVMNGETLSYAPSFAEALQGLVRGKPEATTQRMIPTGDVGDLGRRANEAFERYLRLQGEQKFADAARELEALRDLLHKLAR